MDQLPVRPADDADERDLRVEPVRILAEAGHVELLGRQRLERLRPPIDPSPECIHRQAGGGGELDGTLRLDAALAEGPLPAAGEATGEMADPPGDGRQWSRGEWVDRSIEIEDPFAGAERIRCGRLFAGTDGPHTVDGLPEELTGGDALQPTGRQFFGVDKLVDSPTDAGSANL